MQSTRPVFFNSRERGIHEGDLHKEGNVALWCRKGGSECCQKRRAPVPLLPMGKVLVCQFLLLF